MPRRRRSNRGGPRPNAGRPRVAYAAMDRRTRNDHVLAAFRQLEHIDEPYEIIRDAFVRLTRRRIGPKAANIIKDCTTSEARSKKMQKVLDKEPQRFAPKQALAMVLHLRLSQYQYSQIAKLVHVIANNVILPAYDFVRRYKANCRPEQGITVTEVKAEVDLQPLLSHTLERLYEANAESFEAKLKRKKGIITGTFTLAWGCDSATGQRLYKQAFQLDENKDRSDNSLFAGALNPLEIVLQNGKILWKISAAQSPLLVRTFFLEFAKETKDYVTAFIATIQESIRNLQPIECTLASGVVLKLKPRLLLTMIDGKVFSFLTGTAFSSCPVCGCGRMDLNNLRNLGTEVFEPKNNGKDHNINPQHGWIRVLEHLINVASNLPVWRARATGERADELRNTRRAEIKAGLFRLGLIVGNPGQPGQGGSLDGNTSRRAFANQEALAEILQIDRKLIRRLWIILVCVNNTKYKLNDKEYLEYATKTYRRYVRFYRFYPMSPSIHKLLLHAVEVQNHLGYPPGVLSESAGELWHRIRKQIRKESTRKCSRQATMEDLFHRCLDQSDPVVSEIARKWIAHFRERKPDLPQEAIDLLNVPNDEDESGSSDDSSDDDSGGDDSGDATQNNTQNDVEESDSAEERSSRDNTDDESDEPRSSKLPRTELDDSDEEPTCSGQATLYDEQVEDESGVQEVISDLWDGDANDNDLDYECEEEEYLYEYSEGD